MFQFTREFIINDNGGDGIKGLLASGKRFECTDGVLKVARMVNLRKEDVVSVSKFEGAAAVNEKVVITPDVDEDIIKKGDIVRLVITIGQSGRVTALVNDYHPLHKKQYFYEAEALANDTIPVEDLVKVAKREAAMEAPDRLIKVIAGSDSDEDSGSAAGDLVVEALDPYTRIEEVRVVRVPKDSERPVGEILTGYMDYDVALLWKKDTATEEGCEVELTAGTEGAGTVALILKNKRLLTDANIDPYGFDLDERPIPGALYDQYLVEQLSERRHIGSQVFGSIDQSLTSHVFFVLKGDVSDAFAEALEELTGKEAEEVTVQDPSPAVEDAPTLPKRLLARKGEVSEESSASE